MSDFLQHMALLNLESRISAAGRQAAEATAEAGRATVRATEAQTRRLEGAVATLRGDILDAFGGVGQQLRALTTDIGQGLRALNYGLQENRRAIEGLSSTLGMVNDNLVIGFGQVLNRLEGIENTLSRIESGVMNPEQTRAMERYRTARKLAQAGRPAEALRHIDAAIANDGGLPMTHVPELMAFRAALRIGQHDTATETVFDGPGALADLEEAITFATPEARPLLTLQLAAARFALQDFQGALALYESLARGDMARFARFQMARCQFALSRPEAAGDLCRALLREDVSAALLFAADPLCQDHPDLFARLAEEDRLRRLPAIRAFLDDLRAAPGVDSLTTPLRDAFNAAVAEPAAVIAEATEIFARSSVLKPEADQLAAAIAGISHAKVTVEFHCPEIEGTSFDHRFQTAVEAAEALNESLVAEGAALDDPALVLGDKSGWPEIARALDHAATLLHRKEQALDRLASLHKAALACLSVDHPPRLGEFTIRPKVRRVYSPDYIARLERVEPARKPLLGLLGKPAPVDPDEARREVMRRYNAAEEEIHDRLGDSPARLGRGLSFVLRKGLEAPLAVVRDHPARLTEARARVAAQVSAHRALLRDLRPLIDGLIV